MAQRNKPKPASVFGIDIGKNVVHVVGMDELGHPVQNARFKRDTLLQFSERASPALIGMESCPGSQWLARKLIDIGHQVRFIPAQFGKPYVKTNKNDIIDAEAIAEAVTRPTMRFVAVLAPHRLTLNVPNAAGDFRSRDLDVDTELLQILNRGFVGRPGLQHVAVEELERAPDMEQLHAVLEFHLRSVIPHAMLCLDVLRGIDQAGDLLHGAVDVDLELLEGRPLEQQFGVADAVLRPLLQLPDCP